MALIIGNPLPPLPDRSELYKTKASRVGNATIDESVPWKHRVIEIRDRPARAWADGNLPRRATLRRASGQPAC